jgi:hypothetical protein
VTRPGPVVAVAGCPHPPLLLAGRTGRPVAEVEQLRAACLAAVAELLAAAPARIVLIGGGRPAEDGIRPAAGGDDNEVLSIAVGRQLLADAGCQLPVEELTVAADSPPADCLAAGRALTGTGETGGSGPGSPTGPDSHAGPDSAAGLGSPAGSGSSIGLLVMGDGSARRTLKAPGYLDDRAAPFDAGVESCLASGRLAALAELDPGLAAELLVAGRAAWQVLAGAVGDRPGHTRLHYSGDPFGVWYPVFSWLPAF